jgi:tetratricopeptide (TPR) repeat protein
MFAITAFVVRTYHWKVPLLDDDWFAKGETAFADGRLITAVADCRNALVYSPHNSNFQFHLARALAATGQTEETRSYLLNLLPESPGSRGINLELAEIAAWNGEMTEALRYYHSAVYGVRESDPLAMRWLVRHDLCGFLLDRGATAEAQPEVIALAQDAPAGDVVRQKDTGAFLLRANL